MEDLVNGHEDWLEVEVGGSFDYFDSRDEDQEGGNEDDCQ